MSSNEFESRLKGPPKFLCQFEHDNLEKMNIVKDGVRKNGPSGRTPFVVNGMPISDRIGGCCNQEPCYCRSDVIWYNGEAYDQKPFIAGNFRTRPGNVMYFEGKLCPPFHAGKSITKYGPYRARGAPPQSICFNETPYGRALSPCCRSSIYDDTVPPYHNTNNEAFSFRGLPYGETLGYFRVKPDKICECRDVPVQGLGDCCTCEPGEYNPAQYRRDECPANLQC